MGHPLNTDSFEHYFDEKTLKKGYYLYLKKRAMAADKLAGGEYVFNFIGKAAADLHLKKRGNKILNYKCSCGKENCEHVCAAIFFLFKDELLFDKAKKVPGIRQTKNSGVIELEAHCQRLKYLIQQFIKNNPDKKINADAISNLIQRFFQQNKKSRPLILHLSVVCEFANFMSFADPVQTPPLINDSILFLKNVNPGDMSFPEKEAWLSAVKKTLSNNKNFNSGAYTFLIPVAANIISVKTEFEELKSLLNKRRSKQNYGHYLDWKLIAHFELQIKEAELLNKSNSSFLKEIIPELSVAKAELEFASKKKAAGLKVLTDDYERIKKLKPANFINFIDYVIEKAGYHKFNEIEIIFIKDTMLFDYQVSQHYLKRVNDLLSGTNKDNFLNEIIKELKKKTPEYYFDKVVTILESENKLDELIHLTSREPNKFSLLHRIALKKLPTCDNFLLDNYVKQFLTAVSDARETFHQKQIFDRALVYLEQLPKEIELKIILQILEKISKSNYVYRHLKKLAESL